VFIFGASASARWRGRREALRERSEEGAGLASKRTNDGKRHQLLASAVQRGTSREVVRSGCCFCVHVFLSRRVLLLWMRRYFFGAEHTHESFFFEVDTHES
jgi:hypothetical protein